MIDGLRDRVQSILDAPEPTETATIKADRFDRKRWDEIKELPAIASFLNRMSEEHDYVEDMVADTYNLLVKAVPEMPSVEDVALTHRPHHEAIDQMREDVATKQMRTLTVNDDYTAAMGVVNASEQLEAALDKMRQAREQAEQAQAKREQARQQAKAAMQALDALDNDELSDEQREEAEAAAQAATEQAEQAAADASDAAEQAAGAAEQAAAQAHSDMHRGMQQAYDQQEAEGEMMSSYGLGPGELKRMPYAERAALAQRLSRSRLAKFTDMLGQFKTLQAAESRRKVINSPDEITDVHLGNDLQRMLPVELLNMVTEETEDDFWLRYVNGELLIYELSGTEKQGKGPIIVVCDESGSMEGEREAWSKALSLALCTQARQGKRDFHYIGFSSYHEQHTVSMPKGEAPLAKVLEMTEHFYAGGTAYETPLRMAMHLVTQAHDEGKPKPDIVFITDDDCRINDPQFLHEWQVVKDATSMRCFGVSVASRQSGTLAKMADNVRIIAELTAHEVADLFRTI